MGFIVKINLKLTELDLSRRTPGSPSKVLNLINREPEGQWNERKEVVKDKCENRFSKTKKQKEANQMSEQTVEIANKRRVTKIQDLRKELNKKVQKIL